MSGYNYKIKMQNGQRTKILFVITKSVWGGAQRYVFDLATNLPQNQFDVAVACGPSLRTTTDSLIDRLQKNHTTTHSIQYFQKSINPLKELFSFFEILSLCFRFQPDIIHSNSSKAGGIAGIAALLYQFISQKPVKRIFTVHGWAFMETWRPQWQRVFIRMASKITALLHHHIIVISKSDYDATATYNVTPKHKVTLIHNGIGAMEFLPRKNAHQEFFDRELPFVIGTIAEWTKNKGLTYLIEALPAVLKEFSEVTLCLVGWGEEHLTLKTYISKFKLDKNVLLISKSPAAPYLKAFDVFVLPSLKEGLPYTILEAGLAELPVIATRMGGVPDIIEHETRGLLVDTASPQQLSNAIIKLARDKHLRDTYGKALHTHVTQAFSLETMLTKTIELYNNSHS
ncbi:MAG: hypothetical protein A3J54_01330 [Candidatus Ryanbacteria bacterium RIFCSPHIGHO2_02_FULL_45_13b]|uniref:Glycosyltransferase subfamily 4-like N-terminal domain-containing protein n=1 Tax=Candidatus Ryanbacteria bacterium RIFCSPHIGHO2_02_FULL_45_13b TaxID=1802117 RepID=A0A1G2GB04_9BACT|nr:MAG: hypothetical protein A3J54_01330 [Candidatus Ryanbacteria bacterium RIFCSPHIGHO2_02_FULL_45_13b]